MNNIDHLIQKYAVPIALVIVLGIAVAVMNAPEKTLSGVASSSVVPQQGVTLQVRWGDLGKELVEAGVIDKDKFLALYPNLAPEDRALLEGGAGDLMVTPGNSGYVLNLLWALGLGNKNPVLEAEMMDSAYGGAGGFASTGGWTLSVGDAMNHYNRHLLISLTPAQQRLVDEISENIYRPCCNNATHFPDCNHGMAMLALLELMASQNKTEEEMYRAALVMNSLWFPDHYQTLADYFASRGVAWANVSSREVLGKQYSSASGYAEIAALMQPKQLRGGSCGTGG